METTESKTPFNGTAVTGAALGGSALLVSLLNGGAGRLFGGMAGPPPEPPATQRDLKYERELTEKDAEIGQLKAEKYADAAVLAAERRLADKIEAIEKEMNTSNATQAVINAQQTGVIGILQNQVATLSAMTGLYIKPAVLGASEAAAAALKPASSASSAPAASGN